MIAILQRCITHACAGSFDDTLGDGLVYGIVAVADTQSLQGIFMSLRQPLYVVLIEGQILYQTVNRHDAFGPYGSLLAM